MSVNSILYIIRDQPGLYEYLDSDRKWVWDEFLGFVQEVDSDYQDFGWACEIDDLLRHDHRGGKAFPSIWNLMMDLYLWGNPALEKQEWYAELPERAKNADPIVAVFPWMVVNHYVGPVTAEEITAFGNYAKEVQGSARGDVSVGVVDYWVSTLAEADTHRAGVVHSV